MSVTRLPDLQWSLSRRAVSPAAIALLALVAIASWTLLSWKRDLDAELRLREQRLERAMQSSVDRSLQPTPRSALSPAGSSQLQAQMAQLNKDWPTLLGVLVPRGGGVKLLGMDINPSTGAVRVTGQATTPTLANAYASTLGNRADVVQRVRLLMLERRLDGVRFEVSAQWAN